MFLSCNHQQLLLTNKLSSTYLNQTKYLSTQYLLSNKFSNLNSKNLNNKRVIEIKSPLLLKYQFKKDFYTNSILLEMASDRNSIKETVKSPKKQSKFRQFYAQYGPTFLVVHLTTVVMWIYLFYVISKQ
jgi:hypothetical protein